MKSAKTSATLNLFSAGGATPNAKDARKNAPTIENIKKLDVSGGHKRSSSAAPSLKGGAAPSVKSAQSEPYDEMTIEDFDVRLLATRQRIFVLGKKIEKHEKNTLLSAKNIKKQCEPYILERNMLWAKEKKLEDEKDKKIPAYDKIDKETSMYKHLKQLRFNEVIELTAHEKKVEDKTMLQEIGLII